MTVVRFPSFRRTVIKKTSQVSFSGTKKGSQRYEICACGEHFFVSAVTTFDMLTQEENVFQRIASLKGNGNSHPSPSKVLS